MFLLSQIFSGKYSNTAFFMIFFCLGAHHSLCLCVCLCVFCIAICWIDLLKNKLYLPVWLLLSFFKMFKQFQLQIAQQYSIIYCCVISCVSFIFYNFVVLSIHFSHLFSCCCRCYCYFCFAVAYKFQRNRGEKNVNWQSISRDFIKTLLSCVNLC